MNLKKKLIIVIILLIVLILLIAITIVNKMKLYEKSYYETYTGTIENIDDDRINISVLEMHSIGFYENDEKIEIYDHSGQPAVKSELSVNDIIFYKERAWSFETNGIDYYLREGRVSEINEKDSYGKHISIEYLVPKKCSIEKNNIKDIKDKSLNLINYNELKIGDRVYILNKARESDNMYGSGDVVFSVATDTTNLKDVKLLQVINK